MRIPQNFIHSPTKISPHHSLCALTPFNSSTIQTRWKKKPANTALTRLQSRTRDPKLDLLTTRSIRLMCILNLHSLISTRKRGPFVSVQLLARWAPHVGLSTMPTGTFLQKYPHIFEVFTHPIMRNACCKFTPEFVGFLKEEHDIMCEAEIENVIRIRKILMLSVNGSIHLHALRLARRELGLPENFRDSIIQKHDNIFRLADLEIVELVDRNNENINQDERFMGMANIEKWRQREYREKWLSEFEVRYAFSMNFPTGFKKEPGFREKLRNWQRLNYVKPYEKMEVVRIRTCGGVERYEKRAVGIIHELLCLTVEKMMEVERLAHFRRDLGIEVNIRELLLKHPGIFYLSIKGNTQIVFLREAYSQGCLVEPNPIYGARRKMLDLILFGSRYSRKLRNEREVIEEGEDVSCIASQTQIKDGGVIEEGEDISCISSQTQIKDGGFVIPILESYVNCNQDNEAHQVIDLYEEEPTRKS